MLLIVSQDARLSDVAVWDTQMESATMEDHLQRGKTQKCFLALGRILTSCDEICCGLT